MPQLLRPTIPISEWKIAVNLAATQAIQHQPGVPAYNCTCHWCKNWALSASSILPSELKMQLERIGVQITFPNELYAFQEEECGAHCRVVYHVVGKLLSGPEVWRQDEALGETLVYRELRSSPALSLAIYPHHLRGGPAPAFSGGVQGKLLQIDFRLFVPKPQETASCLAA
jgi:hypothetical protein